LAQATRTTEASKLAEKCQAGKAEACQKLAQIAKTGMDCAAREEAVRWLTDQAVLAEIATGPLGSSCMGQVGITAIVRLQDQTTLAKIVKANINGHGRLAMRRLTDQSLLADIAKTLDDKDAGNSALRRLAVAKLTDQTVLADAAKTAGDPSIRMAALKKVTDQTALADLARNAHGDDERLKAAEKLADKGLAQSIYAAMAKTASGAAVGIVAVGRLTDQALLADVVKTAADSGVRQAAVAMLTDSKVLAALAKSAADPEVRQVAAKRLADLSSVTKAEAQPESSGPNSPPADTTQTSNPFEVRAVGATYREARCQLSRFNVVYATSGWGLTVVLHNPTDAEVTADVSPGLQMIDVEGKKHAVPEGFWSSSACTNRGIDEESSGLGSFYIMNNGFALDYVRREANNTWRKVGSLTGIWDDTAKRGKAFLRLSPHESVKVLFIFEAPPESKPKSLIWPNKQPIAIPEN
jgi:hypothetical protein